MNIAFKETHFFKILDFSSLMCQIFILVGTQRFRVPSKILIHFPKSYPIFGVVEIFRKKKNQD